MYALALTRWASQVYPDVPIGPVTPDADQEFLRRVILEDIQATDLAKSSILYQAIRQAVAKRLESDLSETWQLDRRTRDAVTLVVNLCRRFHQLALQLQVRHSGRPTLSFNDEYDVQDALHAILRVHFDDVRAEEWTPSYAGSANRMDFLLKREKVVVEAKMTRKSLKQKDVSEQLIQDKERYRAHADCRELVCFVYDPGNYLSNPTALEDDLSTSDESLRTTVVVSPRI